MKYFYVPATRSLYYLDRSALMAIPHLYTGVIDTDDAVQVDEDLVGDEVIVRDGKELILSEIYAEARQVLSQPVSADTTT